MIGEIFMFVISLKSDIIKKFSLAAILTDFAVIGGIVAVSSSEVATVGNFSDVSLKGSTHQERSNFFKHFGWEIAEEPSEIKETVIPEEFDDIYQEYNSIQKAQNLDLEKYKGKRVKSWSYKILNYPGYENSEGVIRGNLLTYEGKIIGGDVCSIELGGFMHGFCKPTQEITEESSSLPQ
jgi:hypothetical protein